MNFQRHLATVTCAACLAVGLAATGHAEDGPQPPGAVRDASGRDGSHDFDFNEGTWRTHIRRSLTPLAASSEVVELDGVVRVRPVWNGRAFLEEIEADGPRGHWEAMTVFLYDPKARQWSMSFANSAHGRLDTPMIGSYAAGRIELVQQDDVDGRTILVRGIWSDMTKTSHRYEEDYSDDGGRTWSTSFTAQLTKVSS